MSSVLSSWFYILTLGIGFLLLVSLVFIFFKPSLFLQLTSVSGQVIDLTGLNDFTETNPATIAATAANAVIRIGANSYSIANNTTALGVPNPFVVQLPSTGKAAADDVAGAKVTGTFFFWLLMLGIGFLTLLLAFIAVKYPEKLFGPQVSALVGCLPKTKSPCSSSSSGCSTRTSSLGGLSSLLGGSSSSANSAQPVVPVPPPVVVAAPPPPPPPAPKPPVTTTAAPTSPGFTPAQLAVLQQIMAAMAVSKPSTPTS